ncbi:enoyl-CoA hydratase/isomerase family protein [Solitalea lacus]|uniref:enoyl-CoA hydratase/isomerase family protein n=1 Tax=Solitalea lacus TaxID=2911172 RepID=UPI001EDAF256|nr:enoyl-CoA hydratase-related protein [Solitalea lacus]UKJ05798.1 enoyl-CoA hydratase-related protein [Solitalea lacus]
MEKLVKYTVKERIAYITINRPEKRNALNESLVQQLKTTFYKAEKDHNAKVIVLEAEGEVFSAGADLAYLQKLQANTANENLADSHQLRELFSAIYFSEKITIAKVQGHAIAGGCGLVTVCDFAFTQTEAKFGYTEVKIGFVPALVALFLIRKIGEGKAKDLLLSGRLISADEALSLGLVNKIIAVEQLDEEVNQFAKQLCIETSANAVAITKNLIQKVQTMNSEDALIFAAKTNAQVRSTEDFKKGVDSFLTKTKLTW